MLVNRLCHKDILHVTSGIAKDLPRELNNVLWRPSFAFMQMMMVCMCDIDLRSKLFRSIYPQNVVSALASLCRDAMNYNSHLL